MCVRGQQNFLLLCCPTENKYCFQSIKHGRCGAHNNKQHQKWVRPQNWRQHVNKKGPDTAQTGGWTTAWATIRVPSPHKSKVSALRSLKKDVAKERIERQNVAAIRSAMEHEWLKACHDKPRQAFHAHKSHPQAAPHPYLRHRHLSLQNAPTSWCNLHGSPW